MFCGYIQIWHQHWAFENNQVHLPDWLLLAAFKKHSVKYSVASGAIAKGQDVLIQKYLKSENDTEDAPI